MNCQQWSMSNKFISTVPLRVFQRLSSFLALPGCASRWTVQWPSGDIWHDVSTSTRSQVAEVSWSGIVRFQFLENFPQHYRDGLFTPAELLKHLSAFWSIGRTSCHYLSEFTVLLPGLWLWKSANCKYTCRSQHAICNGLSHNGWHSYAYHGTKILSWHLLDSVVYAENLLKFTTE